MHNDNPAAKARVATLATDGDLLFPSPPTQAVGGFAYLRTR
jgi:hypothetical protein